MLIHMVLQRLIGCLSTRFRGLLISLVNVTKALILLGHLAHVVWITQPWVGTMAAVFAPPPG